MRQRVLVTGHLGYIGSVLAPRLAAAGHEVVGMDSGLFEDCLLARRPARVPTSRMDIRDATARDFVGFDAVIHLAALSNDPLGNLDPRWTREINAEGSEHVARMARQAGVRRFLFSSSCIMYGAAAEAQVDEDSPLDPRTDYACSKVEAERRIASLAADNFSPVFLRNGTVYGYSPRMRLDTVTNHLAASAVATGVIRVHGDGHPWRPVVHIEDVAAAFRSALEAPVDRIHGHAINVGADESNHRVSDIARVVAAAVPGSRIEVLAQPSADQRTYRARFAKAGRLLPEFRVRRPLAAGVAELVKDLDGLPAESLDGPRFVRLRWLRKLIESRAVDSGLRFGRSCEAAA